MNIAYNMDCMEAMRAMPDKAYDLAVVDPPYGIGVQSMTYTRSGAVRTHGYAATKRRDYRRPEEWDVRPGKEYFYQLFRVSERQIIWGGNYFSDILPPSRSFVIWDKRCMDAMSNDFSDCEFAWCSPGMGVPRVFRFLWNGMMQGKSGTEGHIMQGDKSKNEARIHPTQKPVALYTWIFNRYAKPGGRILDTHLGSGSSRIAAYDAGLDFTGYEIDKGYFEAQEERYRAHTAQMSMFE